MTVQEIHDSLDAMLANPKTRNFLNHLVKAYFPIDNVEKVWDTPKGPFKCVLTKVNLLSIQDIMNGINTDEFKNDFINSLKGIFDETIDTTSPMIKLIGEKKLGVSGKNTTTYMSYPAVQEFYNWVFTKSLKNDKHINWLLRSINKLTPQPQKEEEPEIISNNVSTYTLGELDAFKNLMSKFND